MSYQVWKKENLGGRKALPETTVYTLDSAIRISVDMSRGSTKKRVYNPNKHDAAVPWSGAYEEIDVPNSYCVVDKSDKDSRVRGWGVGGKWYDSRDCKRCGNTGEDVNVMGEPCNSCKGSSYKPKV